MPPIVIPEAGLAVASGTVYGQPWVNVIGLRIDAGFALDQNIADSLGVDVRNLYNANVGLQVNDWQLDAVVIQDLRSGTAPAWDANITPVIGTNISDGMPPQVAMVVTHRTGLRGRSFRGRTYHAGLGEDSSTTSGQILTLTRTNFANAWTAFRTELATDFSGFIQHAVVSRALSETTLVTSSVADAEWDHQNRRKRTS